MDTHADEPNPQTIVRRAIERAGEIATLPEVITRVLEVVDDPESGADELAEVVKRDPVLSAKLLRVVNSVLYGLPGQVADVDRAITLLGFRQVKDLAVATSVGKMFEAPPDPRLFDGRALWRHSVAVSVAAREIARLAGDRDAVAEMFLAGLIHDIGLVFEHQALPDELAEVVRRCGESGDCRLLEVEAEVIGATHEAFGEALCARWKFPHRLRVLIGSHHDPAGLPDELRSAGAILRCADTICLQEGFGLGLDSRAEAIPEEHLAAAGIDPNHVAGLREKLGSEVDAMESVLGSVG